MIKLRQAEYLDGYRLRLFFSDHQYGDWDFSELAHRDAPMVQPLRDITYFKSYFLELGALCWNNGLELSAGSLHQKLDAAGLLHKEGEAA